MPQQDWRYLHFLNTWDKITISFFFLTENGAAPSSIQSACLKQFLELAVLAWFLKAWGRDLGATNLLLK